MPISQVQCSVCKIMVNKAQTLSIGNGKRACRSHEGVGDQAQAAQLDMEEQHQKGRKRLERGLRRLGSSPPATSLNPICISCGASGCTAQQFQNALASELGELPDYSTQLEMLQNYQSMTGAALLILVPGSSLEGKDIQESVRTFLDIFGFVGLCISCAQKYGVTNDSFLEARKNLGGPVSEVER